MQRFGVPQQAIERYEYKYLVAEEQVGPILQAAALYCEPDRHMQQAGPLGYCITSLYLDSPGLACYRAKKDRHVDRFKLRLRCYGERGEGPLFAEVKRKLKDGVIKYRGELAPGELQDILARGGAAGHPDGAVRRFFFLADQLGAGPALLVRYHRAALFSLHDSYARVTVDRRLVAQQPAGYGLVGDPARWHGIDGPAAAPMSRSLAVLELKFTSAVPRWMIGLVRRFELWRVGFSKYCNGLEVTLGRAAPGQETVRQSRLAPGPAYRLAPQARGAAHA